MNIDYLIYAQKLDTLGDRIIKISDMFMNVENEDVMEIKNNYNNCLKAINEYKECKKILMDIVPPTKVQREHQAMIDAVQMFIDGTQLMFKSIDINNRSIDKYLLNKGLELQKQGEMRVVGLSLEITKIISK